MWSVDVYKLFKFFYYKIMEFRGDLKQIVSLTLRDKWNNSGVSLSLLSKKTSSYNLAESNV